MVPWPGYILIWLLTKVDLYSKVQWMVIKSNMKIVLEFSCVFFPFLFVMSLLEQVTWCQFVTPARIRLSSICQKFLSIGFSNWQLIASIWKFFFFFRNKDVVFFIGFIWMLNSFWILFFKVNWWNYVLT